MSEPARDAPTLMERIQALHEEIDSAVDAAAEEMKKTAKGVPLEVLRGLITTKGGRCKCEVYKRLIEES